MIENGANVNITIKLPNDFSWDTYFLGYIRVSGYNAAGLYESIVDIHARYASVETILNRIENEKVFEINEQTPYKFVIAKLSETVDVTKYIPENGTTDVYSCVVHLVKSGTLPRA